MQWIVVESFQDITQEHIGPFPSQDQAMSYAARMEVRHPGINCEVRQLSTPAFMPEKIHG